MTLVALANALLGDRMVERFHAEPRVQATELLLQERVPRDVAPIEPRPLDEMRVAGAGRVGAGAPLPLARTRCSRTRSSCRTATTSRRSPTPAAAPASGAACRSRDGVATPRATPTASSSTCATCAAAPCGRRPISRRGREPDDYAVTFSADRATLPAARRRPLHASSTSRSRPKTTSRCGGSRCATTARASASSTSPATPRSC